MTREESADPVRPVNGRITHHTERADAGVCRAPYMAARGGRDLLEEVHELGGDFAR
ncbi:hypothetical protein OG520_38700 [Streptomyces sp. NBC_00984]|uniref:hypothetical protein n=1 Tax=Streptomyces sp. NBC_00984 TaxID=2903700 RepID=UPI003864B9B1|nr:hypothetical protein OG520_38700 [Streptomyces sp. NBC_00984]